MGRPFDARFENNEKERDRFLIALTYEESARLAGELIRFYRDPVFSIWEDKDRPICLALALKPQKHA